jgi:IS30 family transposase
MTVHSPQRFPREKRSEAKYLKIKEKACILDLHEEGISSRKIAAHLGRDKATIKRIIVKAKELDPISIPERKKGSGRIRKMTNIMVDS